jgi:hypothetical protein
MILPSTPPETLTRARDIAMKQGLRYVYVGNVHDEAGSSTYCPNCKARLIGRDWYRMTAWNMDAGCCKKRNAIPGFEAKPGGAQRKMVNMQVRVSRTVRPGQTAKHGLDPVRCEGGSYPRPDYLLYRDVRDSRRELTASPHR